MPAPLVVDLFCGKFGWGSAFAAEGWRVIGFDIEHLPHHGPVPDGCELVLQDVCTIHGAQLVDADCLVASSPCQEFSWRAMPWKRGRAQSPKELGMAAPAWWKKPEAKMEADEFREWKHWQRLYPREPPVQGINLFWQAFRIQQEIFEACGRWVPLVAENVRGAQKWVGRASWAYGSFLLWGDVPALMPRALKALKWGGCNGVRFDERPPNLAAHRERTGRKVPMNFHEHEKENGTKVASESGRRTDPGKGARFTTRDCGSEKGFAKEWRDSPNGMPMMSSGSSARKAASAEIARIPELLARHIARVFKPGA